MAKNVNYNFITDKYMAQTLIRAEPILLNISAACVHNWTLKAKFHYGIWFKACRRPASNQLRTS